MISRRYVLLSLVAALVSPLVKASSDDGVAALPRFVSQALSAQGQFTQQIFDAEGKLVEDASRGTFAFLRPGCFVWHTTHPYEQRIVSNGKTLWLYDPDLMQVTIKELTSAVSATPAAILFGHTQLKKFFQLENESKKSDGLIWVKATPKNSDLTFSSLHIGFDKSGCLVRMVLRDHFSQTTDIEFRDVQLNESLPPSMFEFKPPKGADVFVDEMTQG